MNQVAVRPCSFLAELTKKSLRFFVAALYIVIIFEILI